MTVLKLIIYSLICVGLLTVKLVKPVSISQISATGFFMESQKVICYETLKISLFHGGFGLRTEVTVGHLISDHFKMHFKVINAHINLQKLQLRFKEKQLRSCLLAIPDQQSQIKSKFRN